MVRVLPLVALVVCAAACNCGPTGVDKKRFVCAADEHCAEGFVCRGGECTPIGGSGGSSGGTAGGSTAGGGEAGGAANAGGGTAGGSTAGGATAGGATAGGATAGGATAGGGTAGGAAPGPNTLVFITTPPSPLLAGMCFPATVEARLGGVPTSVTAMTMVGLGVSLSGGVRFFSDAACATTISTTSIAAGMSRATFYVRPRSGAMMTITATAPFGMAMQTVNPRPVVRRGTCSFAAPVNLSDGGVVLDDYIVCGVTPAQTTMSAVASTFSTSGSGPSSGSLLASCWLHTVNEVRCARGRATEASMMSWQTAELPSGINVQRFGGSCPPSPNSTLTLSTAVNPASTFLLKSSSSGGMVLDDDDTSSFRLVDATTIRVEHRGCSEFDVQAVDLSGVSVTRQLHDGGIPASATELMITGLSAVSPSAVLLTQARADTGPTGAECNLTLQGTMPSPTSITVSRAGGGCESSPVGQIYWERIDFGARANVQTRTATVTGAMLDVAISSVDTTRTLLLSSSQIFAGQGGGQTTFVGEAQEAAMRFELTSPTNVRLHRGATAAPATLTFYVIEIEP